MTKTTSRRSNYIGALVVQFVPMIYNVVAHKLEMHSMDFHPAWLFVFTLLAAVIAFGQDIKRFLKNLEFKVSKDGVEVDGNADGK
jgi:hypothetical protein